MRLIGVLGSLLVIVGVHPLLANNVDAQQQQVNVSNVEQLYSAINNPLNVNTEIVLTPGIYRLSQTAPMDTLDPTVAAWSCLPAQTSEAPITTAKTCSHRG